MDKTLKLRAYKDTAKKDGLKDHRVAEIHKSEELAKKEALLEEERSKSHELLKTILQLRESLKQEQARSAELKAKVNRLDAVEENQLIKKNNQLEEEKKKHIDQIKINEQLRASVKQDQEKKAEMAKKISVLQGKLNKLATVEDNQLIKKNSELEEVKSKSLEYIKTIDNLKEALKQEQARKSEIEKKSTALEAKIRELSVVLSKISTIAVGGKLDSNG